MLLLLFIAFAAHAHADPTPLDFFRRLEPERLASLEIEIAYLGPARGALPSVVLLGPSAAEATGLLASGRRPGFEYGVHQSARFVSRLSLDGMRAVLDTIAALQLVAAGGIDSVALYSVACLDTTAGFPRVFQSILNEDGARDLFPRLARAVRGSAAAEEGIAVAGCGLMRSAGPPPGEISQAVLVTVGGFETDPTREVRCRARVVNLSSAPLAPPLVLVVETRPQGIRLVNGDGVTCRVFYPGCPYVRVPLEGPLAPGASVEVPLRFANPGQRSFSLAHRVFSGEGER